MKVSVWVLALASWLAVSALPPERGRIPFEMVGTDQGLTAGAVISMTQDAEGFLWMGSENGLMRYEGGQCRHYGTEDGLPSASVFRVAATPDGGVWAGTPGGLVRFKDGRFQRARVEGIPFTFNVGDLALDRKGRLWVFNQESGLLRQAGDLDFDQVPWRPKGSFYGLTVGPRTGSVYAAGQFGIQVFREDGRTELWGAAQGLPEGGPLFAIEDGQGRVWAGAGRTLVVREPGGARFQDRSSLLKASVSPNGLPTLDQDGSVWIPTQGGALRPGVEFLDASRGLPFRWVRSVFRDREGSLWVLGPGLAHMQGRGLVQDFPLGAGAAGEVVWGMVRDASGRLVAATDDGAVRLEPSGPRRIPGTTGFRIKGLAVDREGTLWMVNTRGPTLWLRKGADRAVTAPLGELGTCLNSVFADSRGRIHLGGTRQGLLAWNPASRRLEVEVAPGSRQARDLGVYEFHEDARGRLWAGTDGGILIREGDGPWQFFREPERFRVRGMAILPDGTAWIHNEEPSGLLRVRPEGGELRELERYGRGRGLSSDMVYAVRLDAGGNLWVATDRGLDGPGREAPVHVGGHDGLVSEDCSISAMLVEDGAVWIGTSNGLARFDGAGPREASTPAGARILEFAAGGRRLEPPFGTLPPLPHDAATVDLRVAAPAYLDMRDVHFQGRLLGLEEHWRDLEGRRIHFPSLPAGHYRFEVRAAQGLGPFGPAEGLEFVVRPAWWSTWWARLLALAGAALALAWGVRLRMASLARSKAALEALVEARTRELRQRNEDLSVALGNVKQLSGLLPICAHCKKIRDDQGYWNQLETYISRHSEVDFSHGICPDCAHEHYGRFLGGKKG